MFYDKLYSTINLKLVNFLTVKKGFPIAKVKRDNRSSYIVYFYFEEKPELLEAVKEFQDQFKPEPDDELLNRLNGIINGVWTGNGGKEKADS